MAGTLASMARVHSQLAENREKGPSFQSSGAPIGGTQSAFLSFKQEGTMNSASAAQRREDGVDRRRHARKARLGSARVLRQDRSEPTFRVPLVDLSLSGVLFRSPMRLAEGEKIQLRIEFPGGPVVKARASVTRRARSGFACSFIEIADADFSMLRFWVGADDDATLRAPLAA